MLRLTESQVQEVVWAAKQNMIDTADETTEEGFTCFNTLTEQDVWMFVGSFESMLIDEIDEEAWEEAVLRGAQMCVTDKLSKALIDGLRTYIDSVPRDKKLHKLFTSSALREAREEKYPWIVPNTWMVGGKGVVVTLKCEITGKLHVRNSQDVFQCRVAK